MAAIHIKREHNLSRQQAREKIEELALSLKGDFNVKHKWDGDDVLRFETRGASGVIALDDKNVDIKVKLGMLLTPMKGKIEQALLVKLDRINAGQ